MSKFARNLGESQDAWEIFKNKKVRGLYLQNITQHNNKKIIIAFKKIDADVIKKIKNWRLCMTRITQSVSYFHWNPFKNKKRKWKG